MGLLDQLGNLSPEQAQGLLAAGAQMLQQSGNPRVPMSFGATLGGGLNAYQESIAAAQRRKLEEDAARQAATLRGLQIQEAQGGMAEKARARAEADRLRNFYTSQQAGALPSVEGNIAPTAGPTPSAPSAASAAPAASNTYSQRMAMAQNLRNAGFHAEADAQEAAALKFQPKVKSWEQVTVGDRVLLKPYFEDGSSGEPVPADVAQKLAFQSTGKETFGLHPVTGKPVVSFANTLTPGESARLAQTERHFQAEQVSPQYMDTSAGIMALPKKLAPGQAPTGQLVMGPEGQPLEKKQNVPQYVVEAVTNNAKSLNSIDAALKSLETPEGKAAVGMKGFLPNAMLNRLYPEGTETRANIADVGSLILHDRSGAAVTAAESPRLMPFIPLASDDPETAKKKLTRFKQIFEAETNNLTFAFPQAKKLAEYAATTAPSKAAPTTPTALAPRNAKGWTLHTDAQGNRAYVSPDGKSYEEVK